MRHSFSFAVTLHRVFDSQPTNAKTSFYAGKRQLTPTQKPNALYVFLHEIENPLTVVCEGFLRADIVTTQRTVTPVMLYPDKFFDPPPSWRLVCGKAEANSLLYVTDTRYELKLIEHDAERGLARIRSRNGITGGCLIFEANREKEIALILEKQSPDIFYMSKLDRDYTGGNVQRVYPARTNADGGFHLAVPEDFSLDTTDYLYL